MKNYALSALPVLLLAATYHTQAQEGRFIEVLGIAERTLQPNEILYTISINTQKFYDEYDFNYDYDQFDPVRYREIQDKVELRTNSARKQLMDILKGNGIEDRQVKSDQFNLVERDVYTVDSYLIKASDFETLAKVVDQLRGLDIFQGQIISMKHSDEESIMEELKVEALKKASAKAQKMAKALNADIGQVLQIRESKNGAGMDGALNSAYYDNVDYYNGNPPSSTSQLERTIVLSAQAWVRFELK